MKSTDNTVFVRFTPPSSDVNRWHLEEFFSQVGPIKKCSVIASKDKGGLGYGFVKFVSQQDAEAAAKQCNDAFLAVDSNKYRLKVTLASAQNQPDKQKHQELEKVKDGKRLDSKSEVEKVKSPETSSLVAIEKQTPSTVEQQTELMIKRKRTSRVIVRNLSFYADEKHVKAVLEKEFGPVVELTLPRVNETLHRGFCFVTFESAAHARKATEARSAPLIIKKRAVAIDFAMPKAVHQRAKDAKDDSESGSEEEAEEAEEGDNEEQNNLDTNDEHHKEAMEVDEDESASKSDGSVDDNEVDSENGEEGNGTSPAKKPRRQPPEVDEGVTQRKTVFARNLPFDTTRNDIFQLLRKFGPHRECLPCRGQRHGRVQRNCLLFL